MLRQWKSAILGGGGWVWVDAEGVVYARLRWTGTEYEWSAGKAVGRAAKWEEARRAAEVAGGKLV